MGRPCHDSGWTRPREPELTMVNPARGDGAGLLRAIEASTSEDQARRSMIERRLIGGLGAARGTDLPGQARAEDPRWSTSCRWSTALERIAGVPQHHQAAEGRPRVGEFATCSRLPVEGAPRSRLASARSTVRGQTATPCCQWPYLGSRRERVADEGCAVREASAEARGLVDRIQRTLADALWRWMAVRFTATR